MRKLQVQQAQVKSVFSGLKLKSSQQLVPALSESVITNSQSINQDQVVLWKGRSQIKSKSDLEPNKKDAIQSVCQCKPGWSLTKFRPNSPSVRVVSDKFILYSATKGGKV